MGEGSFPSLCGTSSKAWYSPSLNCLIVTVAQFLLSFSPLVLFPPASMAGSPASVDTWLVSDLLQGLKVFD